MKRGGGLPGVLLAMAMVSAPAAAADRPPTAEERAAIEAALRGMGYMSWEEIELDDDVWEIDDAVAADGKKYDLKLRPGQLDLLDRRPD